MARVESSLQPSEIEDLASILIDCTDSDTGIGFLHPLAAENAVAFWQMVADDVRAGRRALLVARDDTARIVGTVQLVLAQPENQPHRADVSKLLVHPGMRSRGIGSGLVRAVEALAVTLGKTLLVLDTNEASNAERLYNQLGWTRVGTIPDYSLQPRGGLRATVIFYKQLTSPDTEPDGEHQATSRHEVAGRGAQKPDRPTSAELRCSAGLSAGPQR